MQGLSKKPIKKVGNPFTILLTCLLTQLIQNKMHPFSPPQQLLPLSGSILAFLALIYFSLIYRLLLFPSLFFPPLFASSMPLSEVKRVWAEIPVSLCKRWLCYSWLSSKLDESWTKPDTWSAYSPSSIRSLAASTSLSDESSSEFYPLRFYLPPGR